jgi:hypothetical protein
MKDAWIYEATLNKAIIVRLDGTIWRPDCSGKLEQVKISIHKKTGRRYFNLTYACITKSVLVNRVVAIYFIPNPSNLPEVNHKDGDKGNNAKSNLEWASRSYQEKHAHRTGLKTGRGSANANAKLNAASIIAIRESTKSTEILAKLFGVTKKTILDIKNNKTWTHI